MRLPRSGDLTPTMAVLGLVIQEPDTAAGVALRLEAQFSGARFSGNAAHNSLPNLARDGCVRLVKMGERSSLDLYEGTPAGEAVLQTWVCESDAAPPGWRDALRGKLAFAKRENLVAVLREIRQKEEDCIREFAIAHRQLTMKDKRERGAGEPLDLEAEMMDVLEADELTLRGQRVHRLQRLRAHVEGLLKELGMPAGSAGDG